MLSGVSFSRVVDSEEIALLKAQGLGVRGIARRLGRDPSTISRELRRNAATRGGRLDYRASVAQWKAELLAERPKTAKLAANDQLREYVQDRLAGQVRTPDGTLVLGPTPAAWKGQNKAAVRTGAGRPRGVRSRSPTVLPRAMDSKRCWFRPVSQPAANCLRVVQKPVHQQ